MIELEACVAMQSWVNRECRRRLSTHPCGAPVLRISIVEMLLPTFSTWGRPVRKYRTQLHRRAQTLGTKFNDELGGCYVVEG